MFCNYLSRPRLFSNTESNIPYRSPYKCPSSQVPTNNCSTCAQDELCCNSVCSTAVLPPRPCNAVSKASPFLVGAYVPQCSADGNFNPVQYWGSTGSSWCVDTSNGKPLSKEVAPRGQQPNCTGTCVCVCVCVWGGGGGSARVCILIMLINEPSNFAPWDSVHCEWKEVLPRPVLCCRRWLQHMVKAHALLNCHLRIFLPQYIYNYIYIYICSF